MRKQRSTLALGGARVREDAYSWHAPMWFDATRRPLRMGTDGVHTSSSFEQRAVEDECHPLLLGRPACALDAEKHVAYLLSGLETLPAHFTSLEASRPWLCYWIVHSLEVLGRRDALTDERRADVAAFLARCQAPTGGFCGGPHPGQAAHLALHARRAACRDRSGRR